MRRPSDDPLRRCLKLEDWPAPDRAAWDRALAPGDLLDGTVGPGHHWRPETRERYRKGYGRWLTFLMASDTTDWSLPPHRRITEAAVAAYIDLLREQEVSPWTLWGQIVALLAVAQAFGAEEDWSWLRRVASRLKHQRKPARTKHDRLLPATEITSWAMRELDLLRKGAAPARRSRTASRDALMIALLITCPTMRLRNLAMIEIGRHLVRRTDGYMLHFTGEEMKGHRPVDIPVPSALTGYLDHYIQALRPQLVSGRDPGHLWLTLDGVPMTAHAVYMQITRTTKRAFGKPINPHLFRDCAVTTVALDDPAHVRIAPPLLGHTDPRTTEQHYIQAQQVAAGRKLRTSLERLRKEYSPPLEATRKRRSG